MIRRTRLHFKDVIASGMINYFLKDEVVRPGVL